MQIWARMVDEGLGVPEDHRLRDGVGIAGLRMPDEIAADLRKLSLTGLTHRPAPRALVVKRADRPADTEFSAQLTAMGVEVREADYTGYDEFISNPAISTMPDDIRKVVLDWIGSVAAALPAEAPLPSSGARQRQVCSARISARRRSISGTVDACTACCASRSVRAAVRPW